MGAWVEAAVWVADTDVGPEFEICDEVSIELQGVCCRKPGHKGQHKFLGEVPKKKPREVKKQDCDLCKGLAPKWCEINRRAQT